MYLNYTALCPTRPEAENESHKTLAEFKSLLYSNAGIEWYLQKVGECRKTIASWLHLADPSSIAFVPNASTANYFVLSSLTWKPHDIILTSTHENPSIIRELRSLSHRGVRAQFLNSTSPTKLLASLKQHLSSQNVKAILFSHVSHVDGRVFPIYEIGSLAKEKKILFIVDGAQAVGHIPIDLSNLPFDVYFFPGHKWCSGPLGTGVLVLHDHFLKFHPTFGAEWIEEGKSAATRFEIGTHNIGLIAGLARACELKNSEGLTSQEQDQLRKHAMKELAPLTDIRIHEWNGPQAPGILTLSHQNPDYHLQMYHDLKSKWDIVAKCFIDYPKDETPALRLSWVKSSEKQCLEFAIEKIKESLDFIR